MTPTAGAPSLPVIAMIGPPGSGKGTQAVRLAAVLGVAHLSIGDVLRRAIRARSGVGVQIRAAVEAGELVPDHLVIDAVRAEVPNPRHGVVLDGIPRTWRQGVLLDDLWGMPKVDMVIELEVPAAELVQRLARRRGCPACGQAVAADVAEADGCPRCGTPTTIRADDEGGVVGRRLWEFERAIAEVRTWSRNRLVTVDGSGSVDVVAQRVVEAAGALSPEWIDELAVLPRPSYAGAAALG